MNVPWIVLDLTGKRIGRVRARNYARAVVAAQEKFRDRAATIVPDASR
jgi:hypothetical protein